MKALAVGVAVALLALQQTPPRQVFRGGANVVLVDAYPSRDGKIVTVTPAEIFARYGLDEFGRPKS